MIGHADTEVQQEFEMQIVRGVEDHQLVQLQSELDRENRTGSGGIQCLRDEGALYLTAKVDGRIVAIASLLMDSGAPELHKLFVLPDFRRRGISRALLIEALNVCRENGENWLWARPASDDGDGFLHCVRRAVDVPYMEGIHFKV